MQFSTFLLFLYWLLNIKDITLSASSVDIPAVKNIAESINRNGQPCEDFHDYACGNWISRHPKPRYESQWSTFIEIGNNMQKINLEILQEPIQEQDTLSLKFSKTLFKGCMQEATKDTKRLQEIIESIGGWPMLNASWDPNSYDWWDFIGNIKNQYGISLLMKVDAKYDFTIPEKTQHVIYLDQADLFVTSELLVKPNVDYRIIKGYETLIKTIIKEFTSPAVQTSHLDKKIADIVAFELSLAEILTKEEERYAGSFVSTIERVQLIYQYVMPSFPIKLDKYLAKVFSTSGVNLMASEKIVVLEKWYLQKLFYLISVTPKETLANYLVWRVVGTLAYYSNDALSNAIFEFRNIFVGAGEQIPRNDTCGSLAYGSGVAQKYLERQFDYSTKERIENFTEIIEQITITFIRESTLDSATKLKALTKVSKIIECIGYPNWLTNSSILNNRYHLKDLSTGTIGFLDNLLVLLHRGSDLSLAELRKPFVKNCEWAFSKRGLTYLPYFDGSRNTINFPMAFLQPPMFIKDAPIAVNFGSLGTTLGHEIAHSLPKIGWTENVLGNLSKIGKCIVDEYQSFSSSAHSLTMTVKANSGDATLAENFPDNVGLQMAYYAYKKYANSSLSEKNNYVIEKDTFTNDQLFFLAFAQNFCEASTQEVIRIQALADSHSIGKYRVLGSLRNFPEFAKAWQCPSGSYMNPTSKCDIFNGENNTTS